MRVAVVTTSYPENDGDPSGHFVATEVAALARAHDVRVIRPHSGGAFGWPGAAVRLKREPWRAFEVASWMHGARRELTTFRPDKVIAHWCVPSAFPVAFGAVAPSASASNGPALEVVSHGGDVRLVKRLPLRDALVARLAARAERWRFVSQALHDELASSLSPAVRERLAKIVTIEPGALELPDVRHESRTNRDAVAGRLYVCAGRLVPSKRIDKVIDYVASAEGERVLVVLGDGPERSRLEAVARGWSRTGAPFSVRFIGKTSRREALGWIGAADEVVHASVAEGLSTVIREAEVLGVPVTLLS